MKIVTPSITVEDDDGFKNDVLQRRAFGEALSNLVLRSTDELVISLDGKWGEGKTTFVKMWQGLLKEQGVPSIYIDAFQNDYTDDAFISIASAINSYVERNSTETGGGKSFKEKALKVGVRLLSWTAKVGVKAATLGVIKESDIDSLSELADDVATDTSDAVAELVTERLNAHSKESDLIGSFRKSLSELPEKLKDNRSGRLVIIIDELDRCRPSFSVELLEKIKHLFSVKNVVFLLVMHKEQLQEAIKCMYGNNIDAHTYLQKFINIETTVPKRVSNPYANDLDTYCKKLIQLHELETWGDERNILECLGSLARHFNLSLRQLEKVFTNLSIIYGTSAKNQLRIVPIITFLSVLKVVKPNVFSRLLFGNLRYSELRTEVEFMVQDSKDYDDLKLSWISSWIKFSLFTDEEYEKLDVNDQVRRFETSLWEYSVDRKRLIPIFCEKLSMFVVN
jgi:predicted KAP-like P-loop ATPase